MYSDPDLACLITFHYTLTSSVLQKQTYEWSSGFILRLENITSFELLFLNAYPVIISLMQLHIKHLYYIPIFLKTVRMCCRQFSVYFN